MCGIVGYVGNKDAVERIIYGLNMLEYRGYDSAGIAVNVDGNIKVVKAVGKVKNLENKLNENKLVGNIGIGHTRWATHGVPSDVNAHPHTNTNGNIAVVHNGIIENYTEIKDELLKLGYTFKSDTDTEVVAQLIGHLYETDKDLKSVVYKVINRVRGSYALSVMCQDYKDEIIVTRKNSPLIVGVADDGNYIASDTLAINKYTDKVYFLGEEELAVVKKDSVTFFNKDGVEISKELKKVEKSEESADKGEFEHFMIKEIYDQPAVVRKTIENRLLETGVKLDDISLTKEDLEKINKIQIVACGTAYYAGLLGKSMLEKLLRINVMSDVASEFRYNEPIVDDKTLVILISQSGETADTLAGLRLAKEKGARVLSVVNVVGSSIARESDDVFYTRAGKEVAVASTKAYTAQVMALYTIAISIAQKLGRIEQSEYQYIRNELLKLPEYIQEVLDSKENIKAVAKKYCEYKNMFYIGRGQDYLVCQEGSLKLKEIAYLHCEAYQAGELKHGPIALLEEKSLIVGVLTQPKLYEKTFSNIMECKARGASVLVITDNADKQDDVHDAIDDFISIPSSHPYVVPVIANIAQQLLAYYVALHLGFDVDKPRNLAKSVTVE